MSLMNRLQDPKNIVTDPRRLEALQKKVSECQAKMFQQPVNGGNPFLFAYSGPKPHYLCEDIGGDPMKTAATDGKNYYWNPDFLEGLTKYQITAIMGHESYHIIFNHCSRKRFAGFDRHYLGIAVDYIVNATVDEERERVNVERKNKGMAIFESPWGFGGLSPVLELKKYLDWIDGKVDKLEGSHCFSDPTCHKRSPESVYNQIMQHVHNSPRKCKSCGALSLDPTTGKSTIPKPWDPYGCPDCGAPPNYGSGIGGMDSHVDPAVTPEEVMSDMMRAAEMARAIGRGSVPSEIEAALNELKEPTLTAKDIIVNAFQRKSISVGDMKDYTRFKRRPSFIYEKNDAGEFAPKHKLFIPENYTYSPKWVVLLDTSGSMRDNDIANGLKEIIPVTAIQESEGWVVPTDAVPHWDQKTKVSSTSDLKRTKIVGRGGTVFDQFFRELPQKIGSDIDVVVIITDGDCGAESMPVELRPKCDTLWIITSGRKNFKPAFGRVLFIEPV